MKKTVKIINPTAWTAMKHSERLSALQRGGCLSEQGRLFAKEGELSVWGAGFESSCSPVPYFAEVGACTELSEVLDLGACPFAKNSEGEGAFDSAISYLNYDSKKDKDCGADLLTMCWRTGAPLLDPQSKFYLGDKDTHAIQFGIALSCFEKGISSYDACAKLGVHVDPKWLIRYAKSLKMLASEVIRWGCPRTLSLLIDAGLPLNPIELDKSFPLQSLWNWLDDTHPNMQGMALVLWAAGLDPRVAVDGEEIALESMKKKSSAKLTVQYVSKLIRSSEERDALVCEVAPSAKEKPKTRL